MASRRRRVFTPKSRGDAAGLVAAEGRVGERSEGGTHRAFAARAVSLEVDLNPVIARPDGAIVVDARIRVVA